MNLPDRFSTESPGTYATLCECYLVQLILYENEGPWLGIGSLVILNLRPQIRVSHLT